jgi:hypothetical protein
MPEIPASDIYDISIFQFRATTLIRYCSVNVPYLSRTVCLSDSLIQQEDIEWGLENGYEYIILG